MPGRTDYHVYANIRFPIAYAPAYVKSQSFMPWGDCYRTGIVGHMGKKGAQYHCKLNDKPLVFDELAAENFTYPWRDNFCELRDFLVGQCPGGYGHQGEDIRPGNCVLFNAEGDRCEPYQHLIAAVHDGIIRRMPGNLGAYIVVNDKNDHVRFRYLHMNPKMMDADGLLNGREVSEGEIIGKVATWGDFEQGTSYHLHFNIQVFSDIGWVWVNPYMTLVASYEHLINGRGTEILPGEPAPPIPDKPPVILHPAPTPEPIAPASAASAAPRHRPKPKNQKKLPMSQSSHTDTDTSAGGINIATTNSAAADCLRRAHDCNRQCRMQQISNDGTPALALNRRALMAGALGTGVNLALGGPALAKQTPAFAHWVAGFRARAIRRGVSERTYDRVMSAVTPDTSVFEQFRAQPELTEEVWQYINRRCSDWRVITGKERAKEYAGLLTRLEKDYGVDRYTLLGLWGMELSFGDVITNPKYMRPVIPALAALAWGEPRRHAYWESELINALTIVDKGWAEPADMIGSWGRRHGPHAMDAGGLAAYGRRL